MTLLAFDFFMLAQKGKAGKAVVEQCICPGFFGVTIFATFTQLALVLVISLVTGIALCGNIFLVKVSLVTLTAFDLLMFAAQGIAGIPIM